MHIFPAPPHAATKALLASCSLPVNDLTDKHFERFFGCGDEDNPAGVVGVEELFLLTSTARPLFESLGYVAVSRDAAPPAIRATTEFSSICPSSATLMQNRIA